MSIKRLIGYILKKAYIPFHIKLSLSHLLIAVLPMSIIYFVSYNIYSNSILSETSDRITNVVSQTSEEVDKTFDSMKTLLIATSSSSNIKNIVYNPQWITETPIEQKIEEYQRIHDLFYGILYLRNNISSVRLVPLRGISVIWYENGLTIGYPHPKIPWYEDIVRSNRREVFIPPHKPLPPSMIQSDVFSAARILRDQDGNIIGTIMIDRKVEEINSIINKASSTNKIQIAILNTDGSIVFKSDNLQYGRFLDNELLLKINSNLNGTLNYKMNGEDYILMFNTSQVSGWKFVAFTKVSSLLEKAYQIRSISLIVAFFTIVFSLLLSIFIAVKVTKPLNKLNASIENVKNKNFDIYLRPSSNDEIGRLTRNFNSMIKRIKNLIIKEYEADLKRKEAELKALESQINPHFLYNTLETISSIAYLKNAPEITTISRSLSDLFRYSINNEKKLVTFGDELYHTQNYINIQKIRHGNKFNVIFDIDEELKNYKVIKLILQPIIENSINHGLELMKSGGLITIEAKLHNDDTLIIKIQDNGVGISQQTLKAIQDYLNRDPGDTSIETTKTIGLANVHFRIQHYYGKNYGLTIESAHEQGTKVTIKIPAIQ
jgi:two-component system sensor histidine kinase YesM